MVPCKSAMSLKQNFINSMRNHPGLYNPADKNYRDRNYSSIAWTEIVKECKLPSGESILNFINNGLLIEDK